MKIYFKKAGLDKVCKDVRPKYINMLSRYPLSVICYLLSVSFQKGTIRPGL